MKDQRNLQHMLVTGGAGFIGSNFIRYLFENTAFTGSVVNLDKLTYSGNLLNLRDIEEDHGGERYIFERGDITEAETVRRIFRDYDIEIGRAHV